MSKNTFHFLFLLSKLGATASNFLQSTVSMDNLPAVLIRSQRSQPNSHTKHNFQTPQHTQTIPMCHQPTHHVKIQVISTDSEQILQIIATIVLELNHFFHSSQALFLQHCIQWMYWNKNIRMINRLKLSTLTPYHLMSIILMMNQRMNHFQTRDTRAEQHKKTNAIASNKHWQRYGSPKRNKQIADTDHFAKWHNN